MNQDPGQSDTFLLPSWRIPIIQSALLDHNGGSDDDDDGQVEMAPEWTLQGTQLWEATCEVTSSASVLETASGFQQLDDCRSKVAVELASLQATVSLLASSSSKVTPQQLQEQFAQPQKVLQEYSNLLQMCREEIEAVLPSTNDGEEAPAASPTSSEELSGLLVAENSQQEAFFLALKWTNDNPSSQDSDNSQGDSCLMRPPCPPPPDQQSIPLVAAALWTWVLTWEQSNVYYNMAVFEMQQALVLNKQDARDTWKKSGTHWQSAASFMRSLRAHLLLFPSAAAAIPPQPAAAPPPPTPDLTPLWQPQRILAWECWMIAEAQRAAYQYMAKAPRPSPLMLAKLAAGAVPLYSSAAETTGENHSSNGNQSVLPVANSDVWKCWNMCFEAISEFHQAAVHGSRQQWAQAMGRLEHRAMPLGKHGQEFFNSLMAGYGATFEIESYTATPPWFLQDLHALIQNVWPEMQELNSSVKSNIGSGVVPEDSSLATIPPQSLVKVTTPAHIVEFSKTNGSTEKKLFPQLNPAAQTYRSQFQKDLESALEKIDEAAEAKTEEARIALDEVDLPAALEQFQQEQEEIAAQRDNPQQQHPPSSGALAPSTELNGGGEPPDWSALRERVKNIQKGDGGENAGLTELQQGLWELRDNVDRAHTLVNQIEEQLDENIRMEEEFCETHPNYHGEHITSSSEPPKSPAERVREIQAPHFASLGKYKELLQSAGQGDKVLFGRLESFPTDPKFQFLAKLNKSQLKRIFAAVERSRAENPTSRTNQLNIHQQFSSSRQPSRELLSTVESLNHHLLELSMLFEAREELVHVRLPEEMKIALQRATNEFLTSNLSAADNQNDDEERYRKIIEQVQPAVERVSEEIKSNLKQQGKFLERILEENEAFVHHLERHRQTATSSSSEHRASRISAADASSPAERTLLHLEEALDDIEGVNKHWKQGTLFYDNVIPKLLKLQQKLSEVSTQLVIERCDYDDFVERTKQEEKDAAMAAAMAEENESESDSDSDDGSDGEKDEKKEKDDKLKKEKYDSLFEESSQIEVEALSRGGGSRSSRSISSKTRSSNGTHSLGKGTRPSPESSDDDDDDSSSGSSSESSSSDESDEEEEDVRPSSSSSSFKVDDNAMANLVAMEFDPQKVVAALKKYNNDVEQALNELLSS